MQCSSSIDVHLEAATEGAEGAAAVLPFSIALMMEGRKEGRKVGRAGRKGYTFEGGVGKIGRKDWKGWKDGWVGKVGRKGSKG